MPQANSQTTTTARAYRNEALFLHCILQCQYDFGMKPPAELAFRGRSASSSTTIA